VFLFLVYLFSISAVLLNFLVICAVAKYGRLTTSIDVFITNLAASDIIHAAIVHPIQLKKAANAGHDFYGGITPSVLLTYEKRIIRH